jgi:hypothetical protein
MLTSTNEWIKANELKVGDTRLKCSVKYPCIDINDEITECNNWILKISDNLMIEWHNKDMNFVYDFIQKHLPNHNLIDVKGGLTFLKLK